MKIGTDPMVDCVFKKLFGSPENKQLLLNMVNAVLEQLARRLRAGEFDRAAG